MTDLPRKPPRIGLRIHGTRVGDPARPAATDSAAADSTTATTSYGTKRLALRSHTSTLQTLAQRDRS